MEEDFKQQQTRKKLTEVDLRALAEVEERRKQQKETTRPKEIGGPEGKDPCRYMDWERNGRAIDF